MPSWVIALFWWNFLFIVTPIVGVCNCSMFVVRYFMSILVLQSSWRGRERWLLCLICPPGVLWWLSGSSSRCHGVVCGLWLWYFLIILTYYICCQRSSSTAAWRVTMSRNNCHIQLNGLQADAHIWAFLCTLKKVNEYDQDIPQSQTADNPWYRKEESHNKHETPGRQTKQSNHLSLPHQDDCKIRMGIK